MQGEGKARYSAHGKKNAPVSMPRADASPRPRSVSPLRLRLPPHPRNAREASEHRRPGAQATAAVGSDSNPGARSMRSRPAPALAQIWCRSFTIPPATTTFHCRCGRPLARRSGRSLGAGRRAYTQLPAHGWPRAVREGSSPNLRDDRHRPLAQVAGTTSGTPASRCVTSSSSSDDVCCVCAWRS